MVVAHFAKRELESILYATVQLFRHLIHHEPPLSIQRSSIFACDHAFEEHFQKVSPPVARMARRLMSVQLLPLPYSLRYSFSFTFFMLVVNLSIHRAFPCIPNI